MPARRDAADDGRMAELGVEGLPTVLGFDVHGVEQFRLGPQLGVPRLRTELVRGLGRR